MRFEVQPIQYQNLSPSWGQLAMGEGWGKRAPGLPLLGGERGEEDLVPGGEGRPPPLEAFAEGPRPGRVPCPGAQTLLQPRRGLSEPLCRPGGSPLLGSCPERHLLHSVTCPQRAVRIFSKVDVQSCGDIRCRSWCIMVTHVSLIDSPLNKVCVKKIRTLARTLHVHLNRGFCLQSRYVGYFADVKNIYNCTLPPVKVLTIKEIIIYSIRGKCFMSPRGSGVCACPRALAAQGPWLWLWDQPIAEPGDPVPSPCSRPHHCPGLSPGWALQSGASEGESGRAGEPGTASFSCPHPLQGSSGRGIPAPFSSAPFSYHPGVSPSLPSPTSRPLTLSDSINTPQIPKQQVNFVATDSC